MAVRAAASVVVKVATAATAVATASGCTSRAAWDTDHPWEAQGLCPGRHECQGNADLFPGPRRSGRRARRLTSAFGHRKARRGHRGQAAKGVCLRDDCHERWCLQAPGETRCLQNRTLWQTRESDSCPLELSLGGTSPLDMGPTSGGTQSGCRSPRKRERDVSAAWASASTVLRCRNTSSPCTNARTMRCSTAVRSL